MRYNSTQVNQPFAADAFCYARAMTKDSCVGFVADLGEGNLRRVIGAILSEEDDSLTLAVDPEVIPGLPVLDVGTETEYPSKVGLARVKSREVV